MTLRATRSSFTKVRACSCRQRILRSRSSPRARSSSSRRTSPRQSSRRTPYSYGTSSLPPHQGSRPPARRTRLDHPLLGERLSADLPAHHAQGGSPIHGEGHRDLPSHPLPPSGEGDDDRGSDQPAQYQEDESGATQRHAESASADPPPAPSAPRGFGLRSLVKPTDPSSSSQVAPLSLAEGGATRIHPRLLPPWPFAR